MKLISVIVLVALGLVLLVVLLPHLPKTGGRQGIEIGDADNAYEVKLSRVNIFTRIEPIKEEFISHIDAVSSQELSSINILTTISPVEEIFISHVDESLPIKLISVEITTSPSPIEEIFISHMDAVFKQTLVALSPEK